MEEALNLSFDRLLMMMMAVFHETWCENYSPGAYWNIIYFVCIISGRRAAQICVENTSARYVNF